MRAAADNEVITGSGNGGGDGGSSGGGKYGKGALHYYYVRQAKEERATPFMTQRHTCIYNSCANRLIIRIRRLCECTVRYRIVRCLAQLAGGNCSEVLSRDRDRRHWNVANVLYTHLSKKRADLSLVPPIEF